MSSKEAELKFCPPLFLLQLAIPWSKVASWLGKSPQSERLRDSRWPWPRKDSSLRIANHIFELTSASM